MCGIAGYLNLSRNPISFDNDLLHQLHTAIAHRGPNGFGMWKSEVHQVALVHRRLSIIDLSVAATQPMLDRDTTVVVSFNGEIYNHAVLRKELEALGYRYFSQSDTETILYAYKEWGISCIERFEGMFAIALFDLVKNELYLIRDRIGVKPLYFSLQGNVLSFASEIKALWQLPWIARSLNSNALYHYLTYMVTPAPQTLYEGIYKLPASFYIKVDAARNVSFHEWYTPLAPITQEEQLILSDEQYCVDTIRTLLRQAVKKRMMSDVPFGVFLSGGVDSSLNVALMAEYTDKVKTFNVSLSDGPEYSEVAWARKVAKLFNTEHYEIEISEKEAFEFFGTMIHQQDEPLADCVNIPLYYVAKLLKDSGVTVVQVGEGSDELFCGYSLYAHYLSVQQHLNRAQVVPLKARAIVARLAQRYFPAKKYHHQVLDNWATNKHLFWSGAIAFSELWKQDVMKNTAVTTDPLIAQIYPGLELHQGSYAVVDYHLKRLKAVRPDADFLTSMIYLELKQRLPELLLMRVDKMTMATAVEGRVPFLDPTLVEFALKIPAHLKYTNGITKYILKKAAEGILPHEIIYRKKVGFAAPINRWFKQGNYFKPYLQDLLSTQSLAWQPYFNVAIVQELFNEHQQGKQDYSVQLWTLQNLLALQNL